MDGICLVPSTASLLPKLMKLRLIRLPGPMLSLNCLRKLLLKVRYYTVWVLEWIFFPALQEGLLSIKAPETLVFVTWNIDGLDQTNLKKRTKGVCKILEQEAADIVFLQEVLNTLRIHVRKCCDGLNFRWFRRHFPTLSLRCQIMFALLRSSTITLWQLCWGKGESTLTTTLLKTSTHPGFKA